jgi:hypothetical protein
MGAWEIQRSRRQRETVVRMGRFEAMVQILEQTSPPAKGHDVFQRHDAVRDSVSKWLNGDAKYTKLLLELLKKAGFSLNDVAVHALTVQASELDRIDQQVLRHEARRDAILQQIDRRREGFAQRVRRASEEAVDAEFVEAPSTAMALPASGEKEGET